MDDEAPDRQARTPAPRARDGRLFEFIVGGCAIVLSVVSLFVAISANRTQERMLAASVWPSLISGTSNVSSEGRPQITVDLLNRGTGPARVRWAELRYDGVPVSGYRDLLARCCGLVADDQVEGLVTSGIQNRVLGADEWIALLRMPRTEPVTPLWQALDRERQKLQLRACYCSVLDDCWLHDSDRDEPEPVKRCPAPGKVLWQG